MSKKVKARQMPAEILPIADKQPFAGQPELDQEEVRRTAYFLWEQDGRPEGREEHYWWAALEQIARQKSADELLTAKP